MNGSARQQQRGKGKKKASSSFIYESHENVPNVLPRLLVFDLDNTLWTPELYQIRQKGLPKAGKEIWLFEGAQAIVNDLAKHQQTRWSNVELAIASRTNKGDWAEALLTKFSSACGTTLAELFPHREIVQGSKRKHFQNLKRITGIPYDQMVFFDDDARMNLGEISQLGVLCCHCPRGMTADLFRGSLQTYHELKTSSSNDEPNPWMGLILSSTNMRNQSSKKQVNGGSGVGSGMDDETTLVTGRVKFYSAAKRFGFVVDKKEKEYFFHESKIAYGLTVETGMRVKFETMLDSQGRSSAAIESILDDSLRSNDSSNSNAAPPQKPVEMVQMPCFSMAQPFAALLLNGIKTVESRNNQMFLDALLPDTKVLLHCGRKDWKDMEAPRIQLRQQGFTEQEIDDLSRLPNGFTKGSIIGVLEVGTTYESSKLERRGLDLQERVVANSENIGAFCTPVSNAKWLKRSIIGQGNPGIYMVQISKDSLPDDF
eukprot:scaffold11612_cov39-Attheya_sp.AAC.2